MTTAQIIVNICLIISSIVLIVSVLLQSSDENGVNALSGSTSETFFGKNKDKSLEGKLANATKISSIVFVALALVMLFIS